MRAFILCFSLLLAPLGAHALLGGNTAEDSFAVKSVEGRQAQLEGTVKDLKVGDTLYFVRSPFKFTVTAVSGNKVTVALPDNHGINPGHALLRHPNEMIKKGMATENKLKQALEE